jgi:hypothetical protein
MYVFFWHDFKSRTRRKNIFLMCSQKNFFFFFSFFVHWFASCDTKLIANNSSTGTRFRVFWVKAKYPNQLDYRGHARKIGFFWSDFTIRTNLQF